MGVHYIFSVDVWNVDIINGFFQDSIRLKNKFNRLVGFFYMSTIALNFNLSIFQGLHFRPVTPQSTAEWHCTDVTPLTYTFPPRQIRLHPPALSVYQLMNGKNRRTY